MTQKRVSGIFSFRLPKCSELFQLRHRHEFRDIHGAHLESDPDVLEQIEQNFFRLFHQKLPGDKVPKRLSWTFSFGEENFRGVFGRKIVSQSIPRTDSYSWIISSGSLIWFEQKLLLNQATYSGRSDFLCSKTERSFLWKSFWRVHWCTSDWAWTKSEMHLSRNLWSNRCFACLRTSIGKRFQ